MKNLKVLFFFNFFMYFFKKNDLIKDIKLKKKNI